MEGSPEGGSRQPPLLAPPYPQGRRLLGGPGAPAPALGEEGGVPGGFFHRSPPSSPFSLSFFSSSLSPARSKSDAHTPSPAPLASPKTPLKATGSRVRGEGRWRGGTHTHPRPPRTPNPNFAPSGHPSPVPRTPLCQGAPGGRRGRGLIAPRDAGGVPVPLAGGGGRGTGMGPSLGPFCLLPPRQGTAGSPTLRTMRCPKNSSWVPRWCWSGGQRSFATLPALKSQKDGEALAGSAVPWHAEPCQPLLACPKTGAHPTPPSAPALPAGTGSGRASKWSVPGHPGAEGPRCGEAPAAAGPGASPPRTGPQKGKQAGGGPRASRRARHC